MAGTIHFQLPLSVFVLRHEQQDHIVNPDNFLTKQNQNQNRRGHGPLRHMHGATQVRHEKLRPSLKSARRENDFDFVEVFPLILYQVSPEIAERGSVAASCWQIHSTVPPRCLGAPSSSLDRLLVWLSRKGFRMVEQSVQRWTILVRFQRLQPQWNWKSHIQGRCQRWSQMFQDAGMEMTN